MKAKCIWVGLIALFLGWWFLGARIGTMFWQVKTGGKTVFAGMELQVPSGYEARGDERSMTVMTLRPKSADTFVAAFVHGRSSDNDIQRRHAREYEGASRSAGYGVLESVEWRTLRVAGRSARCLESVLDDENAESRCSVPGTTLEVYFIGGPVRLPDFYAMLEGARAVSED